MANLVSRCHFQFFGKTQDKLREESFLIHVGLKMNHYEPRQIIDQIHKRRFLLTIYAHWTYARANLSTPACESIMGDLSSIQKGRI
jgi:hypothetical protein